MKSYIDGGADFTHADGTMGTALTALGMGVLRRSSNSNFYNGTLSEVANWGRVLSATEVKSLADGLPASHLGPSHYWPLWGRDSPEPDIGTGTKKTGTLTATAFSSGGLTGDRLVAIP
jgi:hypothetical protein